MINVIPYFLDKPVRDRILGLTALYTCHLSTVTNPTATATDPPPNNSPTMQIGWFIIPQKNKRTFVTQKKIIDTVQKKVSLLASHIVIVNKEQLLYLA